MADIYVRKTGDDTTGNGSTGTPYLTIAKAESVAVAGDRIIVGDGSYAENNGSGRLTFDQVYASPVVVRSESGDPSKVRISGTTAYLYLSGANLVFMNVGFDGIAGQAYTVRLAGSVCSEISFIGCDFVARPTSSVVASCLQADWASTGGAHTNIAAYDCTFRQAGYDRAQGIYIDPQAAGTVNGLIVKGCRITMIGYGIRFGQNLSGVRIVGNNITSLTRSGITDHALLLGVDGTSGSPSTGVIAHNAVWSNFGHTVLIGAGCDGVDVFENTIIAGLDTAIGLGLVVKQATNVLVANNTIEARGGAGLYFKASEDCQAFGNLITVRAAMALGLRVDDDPDDSGSCARLTVRRNTIRATAGSVINWGGPVADSGGSLCDENVYAASGSATLGTVRGTAVTTLAGMRAAWSAYDHPANDRNSRVGARHTPFAGHPIADLPA